jgi:hypothetical protein
MKPRWKKIGTYKALGALTEWHCEIALQRQRDGLFNARWTGEEGTERIFGPTSLEKIVPELTDLGVVKHELLEMLESSGIPKVSDFAARARAIDKLSSDDPIARELMKYWSPNKPVRLVASWADDIAVSRIRVDSDAWLGICNGKYVQLGGGGYSYEGTRYTTSWAFNLTGHGEVTVSYESRRHDGDSGEGYEGQIEDLIVSREN